MASECSQDSSSPSLEAIIDISKWKPAIFSAEANYSVLDGQRYALSTRKRRGNCGRSTVVIGKALPNVH